MNIIDHYQYQEQGYNPFLITEKWQVAFLNYAPAEALEAIDKLDVHHYTDEAFILLSGRSVLIAATIQDDKIVEYEAIDMKPNIVHNIRKNVWHKIAMSEGSQVLIIENENTHLDDFEFYHLSMEQQQHLRDVVTLCITNT